MLADIGNATKASVRKARMRVISASVPLLLFLLLHLLLLLRSLPPTSGKEIYLFQVTSSNRLFLGFFIKLSASNFSSWRTICFDVRRSCKLLRKVLVLCVCSSSILSSCVTSLYVTQKLYLGSWDLTYITFSYSSILKPTQHVRTTTQFYKTSWCSLFLPKLGCTVSSTVLNMTNLASAQLPFS